MLSANWTCKQLWRTLTDGSTQKTVTVSSYGNIGNQINTLITVGGRIQNQIQGHWFQDKKCAFRPAVRSERICSALVSVNHSNDQRNQFGSSDHHNSAHQMVRPHDVLPSSPT